MANWYVYSGAGGTASGANWANAFTTLFAGTFAAAAGDTVWVAHDHSETAASAKTITGGGTATAIMRVICANRAGSVPPVSADLRTTALVITTGTNSIAFNVSFVYVYGIIFQSGTGTTATTLTLGGSNANAFQFFEACSFQKLTTNASQGAITVGNGSFRMRTDWKNCTIKFGNTGDGIAVRAVAFTWRDTASAISGATIPTTLFQVSVSLTASSIVLLEGVDLSALSTGTIVGAVPTPTKHLIKDCKIASGTVIAATPTDQGGAETISSRTDGSGHNYRVEKWQYAGTETVETTIVRTGGATDGTTPVAKKIVTTANSALVCPFEALPIAIWNDVSGSSVTCTVYGIWGGGAVPNNDDIWMEVEYLSSSGDGKGSFVSCGKADVLASNAALSTDASTWGGSTTKFKMAVTFTPQQKGAIFIYVKAAKVSTTFYIDPLAVLT